MTGDWSDGSTTVVVVVVTYDACAELSACLASIDNAGGVDHVVVVDNGGTCDIAFRPGRTVVRPPVNGGFGAGANAGFVVADHLDADVIVLLNDDVIVTDGWIDPLVTALLSEADVGAVQPMLVLAATAPAQVNSLGVAVGSDGAGNDIGLGEWAADVDGAERDLAVFTGGAVAFRPEFLNATGGFDERYFLYYEDVDLARRGARLGWRYRCVPTSIVEHAKGASTTALRERTVYLRERNRLWSAFRNEPTRTISGGLWLSLRRVRHRPRGVHSKALIVGTLGGTWRLVERRRAR